MLDELGRIHIQGPAYPFRAVQGLEFGEPAGEDGLELASPVGLEQQMLAIPSLAAFHRRRGRSEHLELMGPGQ